MNTYSFCEVFMNNVTHSIDVSMCVRLQSEHSLAAEPVIEPDQRFSLLVSESWTLNQLTSLHQQMQANKSARTMAMSMLKSKEATTFMMSKIRELLDLQAAAASTTIPIVHSSHQPLLVRSESVAVPIKNGSTAAAAATPQRAQSLSSNAKPLVQSKIPTRTPSEVKPSIPAVVPSKPAPIKLTQSTLPVRAKSTSSHSQIYTSDASAVDHCHLTTDGKAHFILCEIFFCSVSGVSPSSFKALSGHNTNKNKRTKYAGKEGRNV